MDLLAGAPARLQLAHLPTPLWHSDALDAFIGTEVWVKRDDMTGGADAGNKLRKLEYLLAEAKLRSANVVLTCGGEQSNHARATAIAAREQGMRSILFLRRSGKQDPKTVANIFLDRLVGAEINFLSGEQYADNEALMAAVAESLEANGDRPYIIPEGGSNALGTLGYVECMAEVRRQLDVGLGNGPAPFDAVVSACGSGGTTAGLALGAAAFNVAPRIVAMAVLGSREQFETRIAGLEAGARELLPGLPNASDAAEIVVHDEYKGPAYAVPSEEQLGFIIELARRTGLVVDPVYTGKALFGLAKMPDKPKRALFIHTGGLPGLLAESPRFGNL